MRCCLQTFIFVLPNRSVFYLFLRYDGSLKLARRTSHKMRPRTSDTVICASREGSDVFLASLKSLPVLLHFLTCSKRLKSLCLDCLVALPSYILWIFSLCQKSSPQFWKLVHHYCKTYLWTISVLLSIRKDHVEDHGAKYRIFLTHV